MKGAVTEVTPKPACARGKDNGDEDEDEEEEEEEDEEDDGGVPTQPANEGRGGGESWCLPACFLSPPC